MPLDEKGEATQMARHACPLPPPENQIGAEGAMGEERKAEAHDLSGGS